MRDRIKNLVSRKKKKELAEVSELENHILQLEALAATTSDSLTYRQLVTLKAEYNDLASGRGRQQLLATHHRLYETGDKAGKLLAWLNKREAE